MLISFVIPSFNEQDNIPELIRRIDDTLKNENYDYEFLFVDDGSSDKTLQVIKEISEIRSNVYFIELSKNFGHQNALKAGLDVALGDAVISLDADLQHPPHVIPQLLRKWEEGYDIVYTKRAEDPGLSYFKRKTSRFFYKMMNKLSNIDIENGTADFRLMNQSSVNAFRSFTERELFIRGLIKWMGFKQIGIDYTPDQRFAGKSKYSTKKMFQLAVRGITSFSTIPLQFATALGLIFSLSALLYVPYVLYSYFSGHYVSGWTSLIVTIVFFGGIQLLLMGIFGLYLGKVFVESKKRPSYIKRATKYRV